MSSVDHAKCDLLVSPRTKTCPRRQTLQRCRRAASEHDFLRTTNKNCFSCDKTCRSIHWTLIFVRFTTLHFLFQPLHHLRSRVIMNPGFRNTFPVFWDIHSDQMMNPNETQDRYRPGQLLLRQQIPHNTFPPATAALASFQPLQPALYHCL